MLRTIFGIIVALVLTALCGGAVIVGALLGLKDRPGSVFDLSPRWWARGILWASGVRVVAHGEEHRRGAEHVFVVNHVSWYDVLAVAAFLTRSKFVAKAELSRIPLFGRAMRSAGMVFIDRDNRKAAFEAYHEAADRIREGGSVIVYAEGTRGSEYALRPFKKGPFVLAVSGQAPVVPTVVYGSMEVQPKGRIRVQPGVIHVHFLEPIPTEGLTYADRDALAAKVRNRMAELLESEYGVKSASWAPRRMSG